MTAGPPEESPPTERRSPTLLEQMGGVPGIIASTIPVAVFVVVNIVSTLQPALIAALASGVVIAILRIARKQPLQPAISGLFGVGIAAFIAYRTGEARGFYLPGLIYSARARRWRSWCRCSCGGRSRASSGTASTATASPGAAIPACCAPTPGPACCGRWCSRRASWCRACSTTPTPPPGSASPGSPWATRWSGSPSSARSGRCRARDACRTPPTEPASEAQRGADLLLDRRRRHEQQLVAGLQRVVGLRHDHPASAQHHHQRRVGEAASARPRPARRAGCPRAA